MLFRYYFFKKGSREYEVTDLLSYFASNPYIDIVIKNENEKIAHYQNTILGFKADFIISNKSIVRGIERLNPHYSDVNLWVEFSLLLPNYDVSLIINICEDIAKLFNFYVYNEVFEDVIPFKKTTMLKAFDVIKKGYKKKFPDEVSQYFRLDEEALSQTYDYLQQSPILKDLLKDEGIHIPNISFYAVEGKRRVYTAIDIDPSEPFVFPGFVDMIHFVTPKNDEFVSAEEFSAKARKFFHSIESSINNLFYIAPRDIKKLNKVLAKADFSPLILELKQVEFSKVIDI